MHRRRAGHRDHSRARVAAPDAPLSAPGNAKQLIPSQKIDNVEITVIPTAEAWAQAVGTEAPRSADGRADTLLLSEPDERFWLGVDDSRDRTKVLIASESKQTSEYWLLDVTDPDAGLRVVAPRREGLEYSVEVGTDGLYIVHNDGATDFELAVAPFTATGAHDWQPLVPQRPGVRLLGVDAYADYLVLSSRSQALPLIEVLTRLPDGT